MNWFALLLLFAAPFWETKAPADWTDEELRQMLTDSPWAQIVRGVGRGVPAPPVQIYLATAAPIEPAERERDRRYRRKRPPNAPAAPDPLAEEYRVWLEDNRAANIVLAVRIDGNQGFLDEKEIRQMEEESVMRAGRRKFKMTGHFPPSAGDPYLRLAFPRQVNPNDKAVSFELYLPGVPIPFREAEFKLKDMVIKGKLEI